MALDAGKKRRRDGVSVDSSKPKKKKVSIQEGPPQQLGPKQQAAKVIRVSDVVRPRFAAPVVATTPGLSIPESFQFDSYSQTKPTPASKRSRPPSASDEMILQSSSHRTVDFVGKENRSESADASLQHYIGIFDPATGQLQVIEAKKMEIRGTVRAREAPEEEVQGTPARKTVLESRNELGQTFGTKKAKKAILSLTENAISNRTRNEDGSYQPAQMGAGDRVLMDTMEAATAGMATREELQAMVDQAKPVPKGHYDAADVHDVYVADEIVGGEVLASVPVRDWQQAAQANEPINLYSRFVAQRVGTVAAREDALDQLRLLRYLYWVILYWQAARPGKIRGTKRQPPREKLEKQMDGAPDAVIENIRAHFTDNGTLRKFHMDLLMTHCCVFACLIDNFSVDMLDLRADLRLEPRQMSQYFAEIGARTKVVKTEDKISHIAKLVLPLRFPNSMRQRKRR
ncbi:a49-like, RNA polymerase 1 associated factor [Niveomyces insectorum RCEF 264]|uniref:A49-like, RNA polymerase 1 associated factor n=1 Tax=Niveomyces insectorum RCEF 264 TaxID=1081102 RepID=A0A167N2X0_9HYPO|nr:a49-like, RNA polymerase 1 associated factor [Niveomyces insectorum RCEF 264]